MKVIEILYSTYHKPLGGFDGFMVLLTNFFNLFFNVYVKNCLSYKLDFKQTTFLVYFTMLLPNDIKHLT
jgi:hypothetical protein